MAQYTVEDIEIIRQKSDLSYEEAINLLEYHNGSLARSLVDLEKNGRLRETKPVDNHKHRHSRRKHPFFDTLYRLRVKVFKGETTIINLSILFVIFSLLMASWLVVISAIVALLMGYRFTVERETGEIAKDTLEDMLKNSGSNIRNTAFHLVREWELKSEKQKENAAAGKAPESTPDAPPQPKPQPAKAAEPEPRSESAASGTTPVNVQFSDDGNVRVTEDSDGFHEADIQ
ncbi:MAG: hypothetical protein PHO41_10100 [Eubacteriales bacterium]|nr:hypothetical protein [Eubacteriales bacterium]